MKVTPLCPALSDPHGIPQARILEWVAIPFFQGIFPTQGWNPGLPHSGRCVRYQLSLQGSPDLGQSSCEAATEGNPASRAEKEMEEASGPQGISNSITWQVNLVPISSRHKICSLQNFFQWRTLFRNWLLFARHSTRYLQVRCEQNRRTSPKGKHWRCCSLPRNHEPGCLKTFRGTWTPVCFILLYVYLKKKCGMLNNFPL